MLCTPTPWGLSAVPRAGVWIRRWEQGAYKGFSEQGPLNLFFLEGGGGAQHPLGPNGNHRFLWSMGGGAPILPHCKRLCGCMASNWGHAYITGTRSVYRNTWKVLVTFFTFHFQGVCPRWRMSWNTPDCKTHIFFTIYPIP